MMLLEMETRENRIPIGRGCPIGTDAIWLSVPNEGIPPHIMTNDDKVQANLWAK